MFTGIITDIGTIKNIDRTEKTISFDIATNYKTKPIAIGASIACNGCCLTVVSKTKTSLRFDLSPETLEKTNFKNVKIGDKINLEQSLKMGDELGGHLVSGHVDCLTTVKNINIVDGNWVIEFHLPKTYEKFVSNKGSVTINGVSLTVNKVEDESFFVNIIPHTLEKTNLSNLKIDDYINFEIDLLARYVERMINSNPQSLTPNR
jgi:riboflavin synthase